MSNSVTARSAARPVRQLVRWRLPRSEIRPQVGWGGQPELELTSVVHLDKMKTISDDERPFAVRLDGVLIDTFATDAEATSEAHSLKRDLPESLIAVWDLREETARIIT